MNDASVWRLLQECLVSGTPCWLVVALRTAGSGPGTPGAVMAVCHGGRTRGTVGGGSMERLLLGSALQDPGSVAGPRIYRHYHTEDGTAQQGRPSGMICSGSQTSAVVPLSLQDLPTIEKALSVLSGDDPGRITISHSGLDIDPGTAPPSFQFREKEPDGWEFTGPIGIPDVLTIIGGGHVGRAVADLAGTLDFHVRIIDEREEPGWSPAGTMWITSPFCKAENLISEGRHSWVVIMTPGHAADSRVLESLSGKKLRYIGLMASESKREAIFQRLLRNGVPGRFLESIHCPVGIGIGSRTPREIAVSVAAELISLRRSTRD